MEPKCRRAVVSFAPAVHALKTCLLDSAPHSEASQFARTVMGASHVDGYGKGATEVLSRGIETGQETQLNLSYKAADSPLQSIRS